MIGDLRVRQHNCCGQKIAYFLEREYHVRLSVPKIYEILAVKYVTRSKWHKNQKRGAVPTAGQAQAVIQMVLGSSPFLLALYASSSGCGRGVNLA